MAKKNQMRAPQRVFPNQEAFTTFVENEKEWMYNRIVEAIHDAFLNGKTKAFILEAKIEDTMDVFHVDSAMEEWDYSLGLALEFNTIKENYEKCSDIVKLKKSIKNKFDNQKAIE